MKFNVCTDSSLDMKAQLSTLVLLGLRVLVPQICQAQAATHSPHLTAEDYAIYRAALRQELSRKPIQCILLRKHTRTIDSNWPLSEPEDMEADLKARNTVSVALEPAKIAIASSLTLVNSAGEERLIQSGFGCSSRAPIDFVSLPGLNSARDHAIVLLGTSCDDSIETMTILELGKQKGQWKVLGTGTRIGGFIDNFPQPGKGPQINAGSKP